MSELFRNILRRKVRTGLTISGIVVGIFAVTVMGSMTEYFNTLIDNAIKSAGQAIIVSPKGGIRSVLSDADRGRIERVEGVKAVVPEVTTFLDSLSAVNFGPPDQVIGIPPEQALVLFNQNDLAEGRWIQRGDAYQIVIGSNIAKKKKLGLGGTLNWRDKDFQVVGVLKPTETAPDGWVVMPMDLVQKLIKRPNLITQMNVIPDAGADADLLAKRIQSEVDTVKVQTLKEQLNTIQQGLAVFSAILLSSALVAALIGGLAVINTMIMSVAERKPEIGLKKAIGATDRNIVSEFLMEAALIGLLGGLIGFMLGWGMATLLNSTAAQSLGGTEIFHVTPRLAVIAVGFAVFLGAGAGLVPAVNAARLDPIEALRND